MLSVTGMPYDTLRGVIGITGDGNGSLKEFGINYEQLDLLPDGTPDYDGMETAITPKHRMVYIQRSRGYSLRPSLTVEEIERIVKIAKRRAPDCIVMVDNCYGEFVQADGCGRRPYGGFAHQKSGRRHCADGRLHCGPPRPY